MHDYPGKLIVFDGPDGGGKTTQCRLALDYLKTKGRTVHYLREPGGTKIGEEVRRILLDPEHEDMTPEAELLLYQASRTQLVQTVVIPALKEGDDVLLDRFFSATFAYQIIAGNLPREQGMTVIEFATLGLKPDLTCVFDLPPEVGLARGGARGALDRIEQKDLEYHIKVREGFLEYARLNPQSTVVIDAAKIIEEIHIDIKKILEERVLS
ncbi:dTMP kinase [Candidatus Woesearchaeota archaeon]|nr:dTMP kinase [Candidatus Woesearchaeota archaeon]